MFTIMCVLTTIGLTIAIAFQYRKNSTRHLAVEASREVILARMELQSIRDNRVPGWIKSKSKILYLISEAERYMKPGQVPESARIIVSGIKETIDANSLTLQEKLAKVHFLPKYDSFILGELCVYLYPDDGGIAGRHAMQLAGSDEIKMLMEDILKSDSLHGYEENIIYEAKRLRYCYVPKDTGGYLKQSHRYTGYYDAVYRQIFSTVIMRSSVESLRYLTSHIESDDTALIEQISIRCKQLGLEI